MGILSSEWALILIWFLQIKNKKFSRLDLVLTTIGVLMVKGYLPYVFGASKSLFMIVQMMKQPDNQNTVAKNILVLS